MAKPESYKAYDQVAHPSAGGTMKVADSETDALGKKHPQNQHEFEAKECPSSCITKCREQQGGLGYIGNTN